MRETYAISRVSCRGGRVGEAPCKVGMYACACSMPLGALLNYNKCCRPTGGDMFQLSPSFPLRVLY